MLFDTEYPTDHESYLPKVADWQHAQFGDLNPAGTLYQRAVGLNRVTNTTCPWR
jgi:hypothetical protein